MNIDMSKFSIKTRFYKKIWDISNKISVWAIDNCMKSMKKENDELMIEIEKYEKELGYETK